jgi:hypothetical protein
MFRSFLFVQLSEEDNAVHLSWHHPQKLENSRGCIPLEIPRWSVKKKNHMNGFLTFSMVFGIKLDSHIALQNIFTPIYL